MRRGLNLLMAAAVGVACLPQLVLYVWGPLHEEIRPQSRPHALLREGPQTFYSLCFVSGRVLTAWPTSAICATKFQERAFE